MSTHCQCANGKQGRTCQFYLGHPCNPESSTRRGLGSFCHQSLFNREKGSAAIWDFELERKCQSMRGCRAFSNIHDTQVLGSLHVKLPFI